MRTLKYCTMAMMTMGLLAGLSVFRAAAPDKPKYSVEEVMDKAHKGKNNSLLKKVISGRADAKQKQQLLEYYVEMAKNPAPESDKGNAADWKKRTSAIVAATKDILASKAGADKNLAKAVNCKSCHQIYKTD